MTEEELDLELIEKAQKDKMLISKIATDFGKSYFTVFRWLNGDYKNLPPAAYEIIKKWGKDHKRA